MHVHVSSSEGEAKFWLEPSVEFAMNEGLQDVEIPELTNLIHERYDEITAHWHRDFGG
jgi:hypothetical protein